MKEVLRRAGFYMLGVFSLFYIVFSRNFAEIRLQFSFLNFPIFIGEILLFICLVLSFFIFDFRSIKGWQWGVVFYFTCVVLKAFWGYSLWGPLAFRHAALFYYLIFIFFGFIFYKRNFLPDFLKIFVVILIFALCITKYFYGYWIYTLWVVAFILAKSLSRKALRYFFPAGLLLAVFISYKDFILTSRTFTVGNIAGIVFLMITFLYIMNIRFLYKAGIVGAILILLVVFMVKLSASKASLVTIFDIKGTINLYQMTDVEIKDLKTFFIPQELKDIKLFNPEDLPNQQVLPDPSYMLARDRRLYARNKKKMRVASSVITEDSMRKKKIDNIEIERDKKDLFYDFVNSRSDESINEKKDKAIAYGNSMFRIFIWRDMLVELCQYRPIMGFSFGRPFRSKSMEIMNQASGEWQRDGWIEPHNSYLNMIYRMGILGVMLIVFLIWQFCFMVKNFIKLKSINGLLLCSVLINWSIAANFLPILELPYNAIPFWAVWGVALGYLKELKNKRQDL